MKLLLPASVFVLMVSIGMSLRLPELMANWRRQTRSSWSRLLLATFIVPPAAALLLAHVLPLTLQQTAGLFLVGASPGAPLLTRNLARRGFDMHLAAAYQVWGALLTPIMLPLVVFFAAKLYDRTIWIPPRELIAQLAEKEFLPLLLGVALMYFAPGFCKRAQPKMTMIGNGVLTLVFAVLLWKMRPELTHINLWIVPAAVLLAAASVGSMGLLLITDRVAVRTLAVSNANRHVGLALLLSGRYMNNRQALPTVACYAVVVAILMVVAPKVFRQPKLAAQSAVA